MNIAENYEMKGFVLKTLQKIIYPFNATYLTDDFNFTD
jgi:hypothetical protein